MNAKLTKNAMKRKRILCELGFTLRALRELLLFE
jgi:hypothetical protein